MNSEWEMSKLCLREEGSFFSEDREEVNFSADWTLFSRGDLGGSALLGLEICRTKGGEECNFTGKDWITPELPTECPGKGEGER